MQFSSLLYTLLLPFVSQKEAGTGRDDSSHLDLSYFSPSPAGNVLVSFLSGPAGEGGVSIFFTMFDPLMFLYRA